MGKREREKERKTGKKEKEEWREIDFARIIQIAESFLVSKYKLCESVYFMNNYEENFWDTTPSLQLDSWLLTWSIFIQRRASFPVPHLHSFPLIARIWLH